MSNTSDGVSGRLKHYVTLVIQIVPLIVLVVNVSSTNWYKLGLLVLPLVLACVGPVLQLGGKQIGRALTLTGLGLQVLGALVFFAAVLLSGEGAPKLTAGDLTGIALILGLILVPAGLFVWNLRGAGGSSPGAAVAT